MIDGASSGKPSYYAYTVVIDKFLIYLLRRILVFSNHYRVVVLPEHEIFLSPVHLLKDIFFESQIKIRVFAVRLYIDHILPPQIFVHARDLAKNGFSNL